MGSSRMTTREFISATSVDQAMSALTDHAGASLLAGATWMMRARLRGEDLPRTIVSISGIAELGEIQVGADRLSIVACVTHAGLAAALAASGEFQGLADAARQSGQIKARRAVPCGHEIALEQARGARRGRSGEASRHRFFSSKFSFVAEQHGARCAPADDRFAAVRQGRLV